MNEANRFILPGDFLSSWEDGQKVASDLASRWKKCKSGAICLKTCNLNYSSITNVSDRDVGPDTTFRARTLPHPCVLKMG